MKRYDCLKALLSEIGPDTVTLTSLSENGRAWAALRNSKLSLYGLNMGLCTPVAVGIAAARPQFKVVAIDSDGSLLLDVGVLITAAQLKLKNLVIIVFDNGAYARFGPTATSGTTSLEDLGRAASISNVQTVKDMDSFKRAVHGALQFKELSLIVAKIDLQEERVKDTPYSFMDGRPIKEIFHQELAALLKRTA